MSQLTKCNFCSLARLKQEAEAAYPDAEVRLELVPDNDPNFPKAVDVYVVKKYPTCEVRRWACWFAELTEVCAC